MISPEHVNQIFERGMWVIERQTDGVTHEESLLQLPFRGNCMNWVLGHLLFERLIVLELLGLEPVVEKALAERYAFDSDPVTADSKGVIPLDDLLSYLRESGKRIAEGLASVDDETWLRAINDKGTTMWERLEFLAWHEGYHVGQLELLRQLAGKDDRVI